MLQLSIQDYDGKSTLIPLTDGEFTVGRDDDNAICLTERNVSRRHARITAHNGTVTVENIAATWGTRLNNLLIRNRSVFGPGDVVQIGNYVLELVGADGQRQDNALPERAPAAPDHSQAPAARPPDTATSIVNLSEIQEAISAPLDTVSVPAAEQPRLIVESENLRGLEFRVTKSPTVVGRVPDAADLVIDHRSISKEHARLTRRSDGSWEVLDLGSANGIQVNGEPYSKSDVSSGDVLVFGHVSMRFLAAGAKAPAMSAAGSASGSKTLLIAAIGVLLLLAGGAVAFLAVSGDGEPAKPAPKGPTHQTPPPDKDPEPTPAAAKADDEEPEAIPVGDRLAQIDKLRKGGMFKEALQIAKAASTEHPGNARVGLLAKMLEDELKIAERLDTAAEGLDKDPKGACNALNELSESLKSNDPQKSRAEALRSKACAHYVGKLVARCEAAYGAGKLREAIELCEMVQAIDDANVNAATVIEKAKAALKDKAGSRANRPRSDDDSAKTRRPTRRPTVARPAPPPPPPPPAPPPAAAASSDQSPRDLYKAGRKAALGGDNKAAVALFEKAVAKGYKRAYGQLARLLFQLGDKDGCRKNAKRYLDRYPDAGDAPQIEGLLEKCK